MPGAAVGFHARRRESAASASARHLRAEPLTPKRCGPASSPTQPNPCNPTWRELDVLRRQRHGGHQLIGLADGKRGNGEWARRPRRAAAPPARRSSALTSAPGMACSLGRDARLHAAQDPTHAPGVTGNALSTLRCDWRPADPNAAGALRPMQPAAAPPLWPHLVNVQGGAVHHACRVLVVAPEVSALGRHGARGPQCTTFQAGRSQVAGEGVALPLSITIACDVPEPWPAARRGGQPPAPGWQPASLTASPSA
jgi:hypothetical protein